MDYYRILVETSTTAQVLPENVISVTSCLLATNGLPGTFLTPVTGSPGSTQVGFSGSVATPAAGITLNSAPATGSIIWINANKAAGSPLGY